MTKENEDEKTETPLNQSAVEGLVMAELSEKDRTTLSDIIRGMHFHFSNCSDMRLARTLRR